MIKNGPHNTRIVMLSVDELIRGRISKLLFPTGRDWCGLREEVEQNGYRQEHAIVVRPHDNSACYEIIDGLGRATIAAEKGVEQIAAIVLDLNEQEALRYVVDANLYGERARTRLSLPQAIVLAKAHEENGGEYRVAPILQACGMSKATYRRAHSSLTFAIEKLREEHPKLARMSLAEVVSESVRRKLWPDFTDFYKGKIPANTFRNEHYTNSEKAESERRKQKAHGSDVPGRVVTHASASLQVASATASGKEIPILQSGLPNHLEILRLTANAAPLSALDLSEIERDFERLSDKELSRIANYLQMLNSITERALNIRRAARRHATLKGNKQGVLPYLTGTENSTPSTGDEEPKGRSTRRTRKSLPPLVSSAVH